ncbi:hypothetical protein SAMN06269185_0627 [Natronoarchaeum philippinense]|uniref:Halobacterial output domain-containing protein n=1 Tax=Natronoarchaeum philippinense TaxID=558529 RepID=A0A285N590_NATPI|nr:HalOD1 output domain-containing protein [Natronoarchaeum philippinense]SNZ04635.1 hypothetical protein SAMN06269185_0627 [Natronoarchaeum philippinense]
MDTSTLSDDAIAYDDAAGVYSVPLEACPAESPSLAVVEFVAALEEMDSETLVPLYESVDPEALDDIHESLDGVGSFVFPYAGYKITLTEADVRARPL